MSVYFAHCNGYVKIGYSTDPQTRMSTINAGRCIRPEGVSRGDKIDLLGYMFGDRALEQKMHARFERLHVIGEWFLDDDCFDTVVSDDPRGVIPGLNRHVVELMREFPNATRDQAQAAVDSSPIWREDDASRTDVQRMNDWRSDRISASRAHWRSFRVVAS